LLWGDVAPALEHVRQSESIIGPEQRATSYHIGDAPSRHLAISASTFWLAGFPDQALARSREALAVADRLSHAYVSAVTRLFCGYFCLNCRDIRETLAHAEATIAPAAEYGFSGILPQMLELRGWALVHLGRIDEGFEQITSGIAVRPLGVGWLLRFNRFHADACLQAKRAGDGLEALADGFRMLEGGRRHIEEPELHRLKGELLLLQNAGASVEAESCFREAIKIARRQQAKSWELRATMSLARLLRDTNRRDEARRMLSEIYGWFTEGFDTADLKEAKALLDELS
jgi:predicted ATPase